jgi:tetratricopeptide (TPR) repeat protein
VRWAAGAALACLSVATLAAATAQTAGPIERLEKEAEAARAANHIDEAIALYKKGVALKPSWEPGWWYLGSLYYELDQYVEARDAFRHLTAINPNIAAGWAMLGLCEYENKQYDLSLRHLERGINLGLAQDQNISDVSHYHYALLLTRYERYEDAIKTLSMFAQRNIDQPDYVEAMGLAALRKPLLPLELPPAERELVMDVGRAMYDAAALKTAEAASDFKLVMEKYPKQPNVHYLYGSFLMYADSNQGLAELKRELEVSPAHVPALVTIAAEYINRKDYKDGLPYAEKAVETDPQSFAAHAVLGRIYAEGGLDVARGVKELERARTIAPGSPQVRIALVTAYTKAGRKEDAARERQEFLKLKKIADENNKGLP